MSFFLNGNYGKILSYRAILLLMKSWMVKEFSEKGRNDKKIPVQNILILLNITWIYVYNENNIEI